MARGFLPGSVVTSPDNDAARRFRRLAHRRVPGEVLLEGRRLVSEAVLAGIELELLALREDVDFDAPAERTVVLSERVFNSLSQTVTPQGVMAIARHDAVPFEHALAAARAAGWPLVVLDGVQDPGNVGTICRSAAAAGAPAVAVIEGTADPFGPKAIRSSAGNVFRVMVTRARWEDLDGLRGYGASSNAGSTLAEVPLQDAEVLALGSEAHGLRHAGLRPVTIPVAAGVESLNVAAAAAVLLFEVARRRA